jgi:hypothetical protein
MEAIVKLPKHINLTIEHQPQAADYETAEQWLKRADECSYGYTILEADRAEMIRTNSVWTLQCYPDTPIGSWCVAAATLERVLELANQ